MNINHYRTVNNEMVSLYEGLINAKQHTRPPQFKDPVQGWEDVKWEHSAVYILWTESTKRPQYIGEGILGPRIWEHFHTKTWDFAQFHFVADKPMRKLLERFAIKVLDPIENRD